MDRDFGLQLRDFRLTTAEILYHMPDFPDLLQSFVWQDYDLAPNYPHLARFLGFWVEKIDGKLHSVYVARQKWVVPSHFKAASGEFWVH